MFGYRADGKKIKTIDPLMKFTPHIMPQRNDAMVMTMYEINCEPLDEYIFTKRKENDLRFNYMHILIAAMVRTLAIRPKLNRFIMNGRVFKRNDIQIAFTVKKKLSDSGDETTVKLTFNGTEDIFDVKAAIDKAVLENTTESSENDTDVAARLLTHLPNFLIKFMTGLIKFLDRHGMLPRKVLDISPFHTSVFLTHMKSIKMNFVYHHIYNFGTTSIFVAMGKEKYEPVVLDPDAGLLGSRKLMKAGIVIDERICDGLYYGNSVREFIKYMANPALLETKIEAKIEDIK